MAHRRNPASNWMVLVCVLILGIILVPIIVDQVQSINTTLWNFTGHQGAVTMLNLLPFIFIIGIVAFFIVGILGKT
jgi:hypothetical protein